MAAPILFKHASAAEIATFGGKGKNLAILTQAGFPVPPGFVLPASSYLEWISGFPSAPEKTDFHYERPEILRTECAALREVLSKQPIPNEMQAAIRDILEQWPADTAFAIRSSSTFEDLGDAAFAGQHDTYLNCVGVTEILEKVRECWLSLWTDRAVLYRHSRGFPHGMAAMAVVVQQQIACEVAGVAFSINPVSGALHSVVIDANYGLGESVVSGEFEVDHFEVDAKTHRVTQQVLGKKSKCILPERQGTRLADVPEEKQGDPCLKESQVAEIAALAKSVQQHYSWPQDIEWGYAGGRYYLLQSRPVTTIPPRWTRDESAERWPRAITPLSWDYIDTAFKKSLAHSLRLMGLPPMQSTWFERLGYHVYGNQNAVELIQAYRPFRARGLDELEREIPRLREDYASLIDLPTVWMQNLDHYLLQIGALKAVSFEGKSALEVWSYLEDVAHVAEEYFQPNIAISMTQSFLHGILLHLMTLTVGKERALAAVDGLLSGIDCKTVEVNRELYELSRLSFEHQELRSLLEKTTSKEIVQSEVLKGFPDFHRAFTRFLERHGHRELFMDYSYPTWCDAPDLVLDLIRAIPKDVESPLAKIRAARLRYSETEFQVLATVPESLRFFFKELIRLARLYTSLDDLEHYQTTRVNPLARRGALRLGELLCSQGALANVEDVFLFRREELANLMQGKGLSPSEAKDLAKRRRAESEAANAVSPAWEFGESISSSASDSLLKGIPGSPGTVEGVCYLIDDGEQFKDFPEGSILVARTTNPAWTPLFYRAKGLVTESGGPLSHGAVTAREMRLPAVMAVREVMKLLQNGMRVRVNGSLGTVELV